MSQADASGTDAVDQDTLATHHLRELLRIHLCNAGPYGDIMNALVGSFTDPTTHDARRRCVELWRIKCEMDRDLKASIDRLRRRPDPMPAPSPAGSRGGG